ncbi:FKBP-type peptidyl-prolyl cis-trans isomerase [Hymenobacter sp. BT188]|uniref:FKBP-type peptidyl-prolyl cis-trans isomerase n=1 Tax=Hymenobacter sp. BT188 TaxID=2763504 RepID=UPI001650FFEC|nr:FKBP-type peptidyl-prolyl cis-trans isomerase [Hymenobacter sp. BT188]MBC6606818.1 FKBP-type peptidyl-prolyl cis-trans isomerase [Hymenobacter sp. BT188]
MKKPPTPLRYWRLALLILLLSSAGHSQAQAPADTVRTTSGVRYYIHQPGNGATAKVGDKVTVNYTGFLPNGKLFDSSALNGRPLRCRVGRGEVIEGWEEVLQLLPAGSRARVWIPAALAYGVKGARNPDDDNRYIVPPNTDLIFELEMVRVNK